MENIIKLDALCIKAVDYLEYDKIITLITPEKGCISAGVRGVRKPKAKLKYSASPFCFAEYMLAVKGGRYTVVGCTLHDSFYGINREIERFYAGCTVLESLGKFTRDEANPNLFIAALQALKSLCYQDEHPHSVLHKYFKTLLLSEGYPLSFAGCKRCGTRNGAFGFSSLDGGFVCANCKTSDSTFSAQELERYFQKNDSSDGAEDILFLKKCLILSDQIVKNLTGTKIRTLGEYFTFF